MLINFKQIDFSRLEIPNIELFSLLDGTKPALLNVVCNVELIKFYLTKLNPGEKLYFADIPIINLEGYSRKKVGVIKRGENPKWLAVSRDKKRCDEIIKSLAEPDFEKIGMLLGYPPCCVRQITKTPEKIAVQDVLKRTRKKLIYYNNNIFNFQTKLKEKDDKNLKELQKINIDGREFYYLIFHIPCSYDCKRSAEIGRRTLKSLEKFNIDIASGAKEFLKKPILFLDDFHWVVFNGGAERCDTIFYSSISLPKSLIKNEIIRRIGRGNRIFLKKKNLTIFRGNEVVDYLNFQDFEPIVLNFQSF